MERGDYIIFADESGDHGLTHIDPGYPVFVLTFCCFSIEEYVNKAVPAIQRLKFDYFGHDQVILHEHHIRKQTGDFGFLRTDKQLRAGFLSDVATVVATTPFDIVSVVIDKTKLKARYNTPFNPYNLSLRFGLERLIHYLGERGQEGKEIHIVFEKRGKREDEELELEFRRICDDNHQLGYKTYNYRDYVKFNIQFADKKSNSAGLQLADLTARPIGLNYLRPDQVNRAYSIIEGKIFRNKHFP